MTNFLILSVYSQTVVMAIEDATDRVSNMLVHLLKRFSDTTVVASDRISEVSSTRAHVCS